MEKIIFLGLGTNLGDREKNLSMAVDRIGEEIGKVIRCSSVYETEPWGFQSENRFLNMAVMVRSSLRPSGLLGRILMIEAQLGRLRSGKGYKSRTIDIDILLYGSEVIKKEELEIPHPRIPVRKFVLEPLCELAPDMIHPVLKETFTELLAKCGDECGVAVKHPFVIT
ncbi:MAG: 2-amino-4-hydroxy-6-hydroxymethyldihydropteridine diphosphokinase [Bacteroidales bacterium]|jgi:2-amino-4-hydroxy-6-hydroxymethyldihydropteridine diphosphokinase|nr:2-amino-4-hydroxy-6-hydroxymethyldihydropteridine diphosphokinase [Bacteroidales bacterium]